MATTDETGGAFGFLDPLKPHVHWLLRAVFAGIFLFMGVDKLPDPSVFADMMGLPVAVAWLVALSELGAGVLIIAGGFNVDWATRLAGLLVIPVMVGAIAIVHWPRWHFAPAEGFAMGGMMFQTTLLALSLYFVVRGNEI